MHVQMNIFVTHAQEIATPTPLENRQPRQPMTSFLPFQNNGVDPMDDSGMQQGILRTYVST